MTEPYLKIKRYLSIEVSRWTELNDRYGNALRVAIVSQIIINSTDWVKFRATLNLTLRIEW